LSAAFAVAIILVPNRTVFAATLDYTFTGVASGTITGTTNATFSDVAFSATFVEDTSAIIDLGSGYFEYNPVSGTFNEGAYTTTITGAVIEINGNPDTGSGAYETANLFNSTYDNGVTLNSNPALLDYNLDGTVSTGTVLASSGDLAPTLNSMGDGFSTTTGDVVEFTGLDALAFTVTEPSTGPTSSVPEPSTLFSIFPVLVGFAVFRRLR
jgi:hypothetical protein